VVIVDDEELARRGIRTRLGRSRDIEIVAECSNGRQAIDAIRHSAPDLVFLDVQMPGKSGFDVIEAIGWKQFPYVIFVTAHDRYAIRAFEVNALESLARDRDRDLGRRLASVLSEIGCKDNLEKKTDRIVVRSAGRVVFVRTSDIDWIEAAGDYVTLHAGKKSWLLRATISEMDAKLQDKGFARIHRSAIVNTERIAEMRALDNGDYRVILRDGAELKLSRNYRERMQNLVGGGS
jgi:two-component system LytT family response regulator